MNDTSCKQQRGRQHAQAQFKAHKHLSRPFKARSWAYVQATTAFKQGAAVASALTSWRAPVCIA